MVTILLFPLFIRAIELLVANARLRGYPFPRKHLTHVEELKVSFSLS